MTDFFLVLDVETPNQRNDRVCSLGIATIKDREITGSLNYYVNPDCHFDQLNTSLHGITFETVKDSPTFPKVWNALLPIVSKSIIVAHNAQFDLSVIAKALRHYSIEIPSFFYIDTLKVSRSAFPSLTNYRLNTICSYLSIELNHHNSESDALATAKLIQKLLNEGYNLKPFICQFDSKSILSANSNFKYSYKKSAISKSLEELEALVTDILADDRISVNEFSLLTRWIENHTELEGNYPYDSIYSSIKQILADRVVEEEELVELKKQCNKLLDPVPSVDSCLSIHQLAGTKIVLSGDFVHGSKSQVSDYLEKQGAIIQNAVTQKTNIVLVGDYGNDAWVSGNYGTKIKKALELQSKGFSIKVIKECDFFKEGWV